jgi:hypothetical protein
VRAAGVLAKGRMFDMPAPGYTEVSHVIYTDLIKLLCWSLKRESETQKRDSFCAYHQLKVPLFISVRVSVEVNGETCSDSVWCMTFVKTVTS